MAAKTGRTYPSTPTPALSATLRSAFSATALTMGVQNAMTLWDIFKSTIHVSVPMGLLAIV